MPRSKYSLAGHPEARQRALWLIRDYPRIRDRLEALDGFDVWGYEIDPDYYSKAKARLEEKQAQIRLF